MVGIDPMEFLKNQNTLRHTIAVAIIEEARSIRKDDRADLATRTANAVGRLFKGGR